MGFFNGFCKIYLTVLRGTPVVVQLMIFAFVIFSSVRNKLVVAGLAFGLNSGAYVAEIIRGGIMAIDNGQFEAGRSLGFNYFQTMQHIIIPQVFKNVLLMDLTKAGDTIRGRTYSPFMPLIAVALIYLALVMFLTWIVGRVERRLRNSDH